MTEATTLRDIAGMGSTPNALADSTLILIDCQNTYRRGVMQLAGVEDALVEARRLLERARALGVPVIHIQHDGGAGSPYDVDADIGRIADPVAPTGSEAIIRKQYPNSFVGTDLHDHLQKLGATSLVLAGFMTHMCVNSTARGAFNLGYAVTVVGDATATRALPSAGGKVIPAQVVHDTSLAAIGDLFGVVVGSTADIAG